VLLSLLSRAAAGLSTAHPGVYDVVQALLGAKHSRRRLAPWLAAAGGKRVLDVGAGTGLQRALLPDTAAYVWLDPDRNKLRGYRARYADGGVIVGDGGALPLKDRSVDLGLCVAVSHHLPDGPLDALFAELDRVVRERVVFLDAVLCPTAPIGRLLWRWDAGSHPRPAEVLLRAMERRLEIEHVEQYRVYHRYLLCVARPRRRGDP